jgi:hypothetical protein
MPRRNFHAERARHAANEHALRAAIHALLKAEYPGRDHALVGWPSILSFLSDLRVCRLNLEPLNHRIVGQWHRDRGFPLLRGNRNGRQRCPPFTTTFAATAWLLSQFTAHPCFAFTPSPLHVKHAA